MLTTIVTSGDFQEVRIPKMILRRANISENDFVDLTIEDGKIMVEKSQMPYENIVFGRRAA